MFGLLGLMGLVAVGMAVDAVFNDGSDEGDDTSVRDMAEDDSDPAAEEDVPPETGALIDASLESNSVTDPETSLAEDGMPHSDDLVRLPDGGLSFRGTDAGEVFNGGSGEDDARGGEGNDALGGGAGTDTLAGDGGNDILDGGDGDDRLRGGDGDDALRGGAGGDVLWGNSGNDQIGGWEGDDTLAGGAGDDSLLGGDGNDAARGGDGADWLAGGAGDDSLFGGAGADAFLLGQTESTVMDYDRAEDQLVLVYDPAAHPAPEVLVADDGPDAVISLDGVPLARVAGGAGLAAGDVVLRSA